MLRVVGLAFLVAVAASWISGGNGVVVAVAFFGVIALLAFSLFSGRAVLKCPYCHKRVKLGASTCHHCGRQVATPRALGAPRTSVDDVSRQCPHCMSGIHPQASVCPVCRREVEPWQLRDGRWWMRDETGAWLWLDQDREVWNRAS